jgi:hypothetical protein
MGHVAYYRLADLAGKSQRLTLYKDALRLASTKHVVEKRFKQNTGTICGRTGQLYSGCCFAILPVLFPCRKFQAVLTYTSS